MDEESRKAGNKPNRSSCFPHLYLDSEFAQKVHDCVEKKKMRKAGKQEISQTTFPAFLLSSFVFGFGVFVQSRPGAVRRRERCIRTAARGKER
jgi:hypothetical protein